MHVSNRYSAACSTLFTVFSWYLFSGFLDSCKWASTRNYFYACKRSSLEGRKRRNEEVWNWSNTVAMEWTFSANRSSRKLCMKRSWRSHATELVKCGNSGDHTWSYESGRIWRCNKKCNAPCVFRDTLSNFFFSDAFYIKKNALPNFLVMEVETLSGIS